MTLILFKNQVNHENVEISIKQWPNYGIFEKFLFSNGSLRTSSTRILLFIRVLEHPNYPLFPDMKRILKEAISMTLIPFEHEARLVRY